MDAENGDGIRLPSQLMPYDEANGSSTDSENDLNSVAAAALAAISELNPDDQRIADIKSRCVNIEDVRRLAVADLVASEDLQNNVFQQVFAESWAFFLNSSPNAFKACHDEIWAALGQMVQFCAAPDVCRIRQALLFMAHLLQTLHSNALILIYQSNSLQVSEFFCRQLVDHGYVKFFSMAWEASAAVQKLDLASFNELFVTTVSVLTVMTPQLQFLIRVGDVSGNDAQLSEMSKEGNNSFQDLWRSLPDLFRNCLSRLPETALRQDFLQSTSTLINEHLVKKCSLVDRHVLLSVTSMRSNLFSFLIAHSPVLEARIMALQSEQRCLESSRIPIELRILLNSLHNIVQSIYNEGMHIELIRRSVGVMVLLSIHRKLTVELLNCIWSAANERHESEQRVILDVFCELMENRTAALDRDLLIEFWSQIRSSFATVTITDRHFRLLVAMSKLVTLDAVRQNQQFEPMALDFFVDKLAIEADSIEFFKLFDMFSPAFNSVVNFHNMLPFMDWMCGKLANVCETSELSEKLTFKCWMFSSIWSSAIGSIQARLFEDFNLLELLTRQLFPAELPPATQARHLQLRLHYLTNVCLHRPASFTVQNFESMWNLVFVADSAVSSEFCEFICRSISIFDASVQTCIRLKISKIPQVSLTIPLFRCVVALARTSDGTRLPLKWLLGVLFHCTNPRTVAHARQYFQNLLVRLCVHSHNPHTVPALFEFAVKLCVQRIKRLSAATKLNRQQQRHKLRAAFAALQILVSDRTPGKRSMPHALLTRSTQQIIFQFVNGAGVWQHQALDFPVTALCGDIVGTAARLVNRDSNSVVLTIDGVVLKRSLSMLPITYFPHEARFIITVAPLVNDASQPIVLDEDADMTASPRPPPAPVSLPDLSYSAACEVEHPSTILSRDRYFAVLFDLLSTRSKQKQCKLVAKLAWQIILKLPSSQQLLSQFASQSLDWSKYLSPKEYFYVQYSIQILDSFLKQLEVDTPHKVQWITTFAANGGLKHLNRTIRSLVPLALKGQSKLPYLDLFQQVLCIFDVMIQSSVVRETPEISTQVYSIVNVNSWLQACLLATKLSNSPSYQTCTSTSQPKLYALRQCVRYILNAVIVACSLNPDGLDEFHVALKDTKNKSSQSGSQFSDWLATILLTEADSNGVSDLVSSALLEVIRNRMQQVNTQSAFEQAYHLLCVVLPRVPQAQHSSSPQVFLKFVTQLVEFVGSAGTVKLETIFSPDNIGYIEAEIDPARNVEMSASTLINLTTILVNWLLCNKNVQVDSFDFFTSDSLDQQFLVEKSFDGIQNNLLFYVLRITSSLVACLYCSHSHFAQSVPVWSPSELLSVLYSQYLFDLPQQLPLRDKSDSPRCKSSTTRDAAFSLVSCLSACFPAANHRLLDMMSQEASAPVAEHTSFVMVSNSQVRTSHSYVGLINQGATCYMNSLMQQLFMTPEFRYRLLGCQGELATGETSDQKQTLHQMQVLFSNLQESLRCELVTTAFTKSFKDYDGNPMNPSVQMDVDEFFNVLFDKLDNALMGTPHAGMPENVFGGRIVNQLVGKDCKHVKEREEKFLTLSLDIKNKRTLLEALSLYVQGEWLDGDNKYLCGQCNKKVDTLKRVCVKSLPRHLILHLKRFEFNLETMRKYKVNDYCEFPMELDMEPYTAEGIARREASSPSAAEPAVAAAAGSSCRYKLRGVLVHTGTSDSGHYYSFIRERLPAGQNERVWYQFNDDAVTEFPEADLPDACFGGKQALLNSDPKFKQHQIDKVNNAYMLFYDRIDDDVSGDAASSDRVMTLMPTETADQVVQPVMLDSVSRDNAQFVRNFVEFEPCRLKFMWAQLLSMAVTHRDSLNPLVNRFDFKNPLLCIIRVAIQFLDHTFAHAKSKMSILPTWSVDICNRLAAHPLAALYFLHSLSAHDSCLEKLMLRILPVNSRELTVSMLARLLKFCSGHQNSTFIVDAAAEPVATDSIENQASDSEVQLNYQSVLSLLMSALRNLLRSVTCKMLDPVANLILQIARLGCVERRIMVDSGLFEDVVFALVGRKAFKLSNRKDEDLVRLLPLVHVVHLVMVDVTPEITPLLPADLYWAADKSPGRAVDPMNDMPELRLSEQVSRVLYRLPPTSKPKKSDLAQPAFEPNELVFVEMLVEEFAVDSPVIVGELLARLSHDDQALFRQICRLICNDILSVESPGYFTLIEILIRVELRSQLPHCRRMFEYLLANFECKKVNQKQVGNAMGFLVLMVQHVPIVGQVLWVNLGRLITLLYEPAVAPNVRLLVQRLITQELASKHDQPIAVDDSGEPQSFSVFDLILNYMPKALRCKPTIISYLQILDFFCTNDDHRALIGDPYMSEICSLLPVIGKNEHSAAELEQRAVFAFVMNLLKCGSNFDAAATSEAMFVQIMNSRVYGVDSNHTGFARTVYTIRELCAFVNEACRLVPERINSLALCSEWLWAVLCFFQQYPALLQMLEPAFATIFRSPAFRSRCLNPYCTFIASNIPQLERNYQQLSSCLYALNCMIAGSSDSILDEAPMSESVLKALERTATNDLINEPRFATQIHAVERLLNLLEYVVDRHTIGLESVLPVDFLARASCLHDSAWRPVTVRFIQIQLNAMAIIPHLALDRIYCVGEYLYPALPHQLPLAIEALTLQTMSTDFFRLVLTLIGEDLQTDKYLMRQMNGPCALFMWAMACALCQDAELMPQSRQVGDQIVAALTTAGFQLPAVNLDDAPELEHIRALILQFSAPSHVATSESQHF